MTRQSSAAVLANPLSLQRFAERLPAGLPNAIVAVIAFAAILNVALYSSFAATPIVQADAWLFLDNFVSHYYSGKLTLADFFVQRGPGDHAQPVQKLILLFHTIYFGMDFRIEGLIGTGFAALLCCIVYLQMDRTAATPLRRALAAALAGSVFALWLSLNANNIYTWSLVTIGFLVQAFACAFLGFFFWACIRNRNFLLLPAAFVLGLVIDEVAIITIAVAAAAAWLTQITRWRPLLAATAFSVVGLIAARTLLSLAADSLGSSSTAFDFGASLGRLFSADFWKAAVVPLSSSLIYAEHLQKWFPDRLNAWIGAVAAIGALLHLYFWGNVYRMRRAGHTGHQVALAVALMLLSYALTLGIVVSRVPEYGWDYLYQPRYVVFYQIANVAIVLLMHYRISKPASTGFGARSEAVFAGLAVLALLCVQVPISKSSWGLVPYLTPYWQNAAFAMGQSVAHAEIRPAQCPSNYDFCNLEPARRAELIAKLKGYQLNVFSPGFQARNRIYPDTASMPGFAENAAATAPPP